MVDVVFEVLAAGLHLWGDKLKTRYVDKLISLKEKYNEEINKPESSRSDAVIDGITFELRTLSLAFGASVSTTNTKV